MSKSPRSDKNQWNKFRSHMKGKGYSLKELSIMYRTKSTPAHGKGFLRRSPQKVRVGSRKKSTEGPFDGPWTSSQIISRSSFSMKSKRGLVIYYEVGLKNGKKYIRKDRSNVWKQLSK